MNYKCPYCNVERSTQPNYIIRDNKSEIKTCKSCGKEYVIRINIIITAHKIEGASNENKTK